MNGASNKASEIKQLVTFELEDDIFGMDIMVAQENLRFEEIRPIPNSPDYFEGFRNLRGEIIPILNFKKLFNFSKFDMEKNKYIIRIEIEDAQFGIVVDKVLRVVYYDESKIKATKSDSSDISNYILGVIESEGELISILDMKAIFNYADKTLLIGSDDDEYIIKHRRDKNFYINFNNETLKAIEKTLQKVKFPVKRLNELQIRRFIAKIIANKDLNLESAIKYIISKVKDYEYFNNFNYRAERIFFDLDVDYTALQKLLCNVIIPRKRKNKDKKLRIWNIGCSSGVEAYSIAFIIKNYIEDFFNWDIEIICSGTDYDKLISGEKGIYKKSYFDKFYVKNFEEFLKIEDEEEVKSLKDMPDEIEIIDEIKKMVIFDMRDINDSPPIKSDIIFARHILTDIDSENKIRKVIDIYSKSLKENDILMLSELEGIESYTKDFKRKEIINRPYYIKL